MQYRKNNNEWIVWEQNASPMLLTMTLNAAFVGMRSYLGTSFFNSIVIYEYDDDGCYQARWYYRIDEERFLGQKMLDMLLCPSYLSLFNAGIMVAEKQLKSKAANIWDNYTEYTLDEAVDSFEELLRLYYDYYNRAWFCEPVLRQIEHLIADYVARSGMGEFLPSDSVQSLFFTEKESFSVVIIRDLLECALLIDVLILEDDDFKKLVLNQERSPDFSARVLNKAFSSKNEKYDQLARKLQEHAMKYHWKSNNYFSSSYVSPSDVLLDIVDEQHKNCDGFSAHYLNLLAFVNEAKSKQQKTKDEIYFNLPDYYKALIDVADNMGSTMKDDRKKINMVCNSVFDALLGIVSKEVGVCLDDIHMLIPQELRCFIENPSVYRERFNERRNLFLCVQTDFPLIDDLIDGIEDSDDEGVLAWHIQPMDEPFIAEGEIAERVISELQDKLHIFELDGERSRELRGTVVYSDKCNDVIEGVVRIIRSPKVERLLDGEILVAPTTTPDYLNAIHKCAAIITDWGSQTSHAAIVSRELKKPCIIGTNHATRVLKTGQRVRINFSDAHIEIVECEVEV